MAGKNKKTAAENTESVENKTEEVAPKFVLDASRPGHLRALMAAMASLPDTEIGEAMTTLREFELYEEAHR